MPSNQSMDSPTSNVLARAAQPPKGSQVQLTVRRSSGVGHKVEGIDCLQLQHTRGMERLATTKTSPAKEYKGKGIDEFGRFQ